MSNWIDNKTVIITGASAGIGKGVTETIIKKHNCKVIGIARSQEKTEKFVEELGEYAKNFSYRLFDVSVKENWFEFAEYLKENTKCFVIPCGGCFRDGQKKSEAQIIKEHLIKLGINEERFVLEDKSTTTFENFENAFEVIKAHSGKNPNEFNVAFLSSDYHLRRAGIIAKRRGFEKIGKVSCENKKGRIQNYIREYFVAYELLEKDKR